VDALSGSLARVLLKRDHQTFGFPSRDYETYLAM
jgi:hypothetical protein